MKGLLNKRNISYWPLVFVSLIIIICLIYYYFIKFFYNSIMVEEIVKEPFSLSEPSIPLKKIDTGVHVLTIAQVEQYLDSLKNTSKYRDPFLSESEVQLKTALFKTTLPRLQGIIKIGNTWMAIIDGKTVIEGEMIDGFLIMNITPKVVTIKKGEQIFQLSP